MTELLQKPEPLRVRQIESYAAAKYTPRSGRRQYTQASENCVFQGTKIMLHIT